MYCKNCGKELGTDKEVCAVCGVTRGNGVRCCTDCGARLVDGKCPKCSVPAPEKEVKPAVSEEKKKPVPQKKEVREPKKNAEPMRPTVPAAKEEKRGLDKLLSLFRRK